MALNSEDKADVSRHMGKALAKKVSKVTRDASGYGAHFKGEGDGAAQKRNDLQRSKFKMKARKYDRENPKTNFFSQNDPGVRALNRGVGFGDPRK